jgi:cyanate permease
MPAQAGAPQGPAGSLRGVPADLLIVACGVVAALHVGKLPTALPLLRTEFGLGLVQAGFLLSLVQAAAMALALALGLAVGRIGLRRALLLGLLVLAAGSAAGAWAGQAAALLAWRALEGVGFLLVSVAAPALIRRLVPPQRLSLSMGLWGTYMPAGTALALLLGPVATDAVGWRAWWMALALLAAGVAAWAAWRLGYGGDRNARAAGAGVSATAGTRGAAGFAGTAATAGASAAAAASDPLQPAWTVLLRTSVGAPGPWIVGAAFACYAAQWLTVIGFLPTIHAEAGLSAAQAGALTALVALVNVGGNLAAGRLLQRGWQPCQLLHLGFGAMAVGAWVAFGLQEEASALLRHAALLLFSAVGGLIPATLFTCAVRVAPGSAAVPVVVGLTIQCSALGQFAGPPLAAAWAAAHGSWSATWMATGAAAAAGALLATRLCRPAPP